jgi:hypothetical protein
MNDMKLINLSSTQTSTSSSPSIWPATSEALIVVHLPALIESNTFSITRPTFKHIQSNGSLVSVAAQTPTSFFSLVATTFSDATIIDFNGTVFSNETYQWPLYFSCKSLTSSCYGTIRFLHHFVHVLFMFCSYFVHLMSLELDVCARSPCLTNEICQDTTSITGLVSRTCSCELIWANY